MRNPYVQFLESILPLDVIYVIDSYFEYPKKKKPFSIGYGLQRELQQIQRSSSHKSAMYMYGLEDFCVS